MGRIVTILLLTVFLASSCTTKFAKIMKSKDYEYKYKMAEQYYANKKYQEALRLFEDIFPYLKGTQRYEDLYYKYAYSYYYIKDYLNAENMFKSFVENFPASTKSQDCEYMRAYCFYKQSPKVELDQTNTTKTMGLMQAFISTHPTSTRVKEATDIIDLCR
ncbi:MAG: outer membrane protein assembly factor BamD, partial [Sphingobacteriia bacterium 32-37-4]